MAGAKSEGFILCLRHKLGELLIYDSMSFA